MACQPLFRLPCRDRSIASMWSDRGFPRKCEIEPASLFQFTFRPDAAAMRLDDMFHDRQPKPRTYLFPGPSLIHAVKSFENAIERFVRNPGSIVHHCYFGGVVGERSGLYLHSTVFATILNRIVEQVREHLVQPLTVAQDDGVCRDLVLNMDSLGRGAFLKIRN